jgi:putative Mg2+ transporter-C (MgtC) family protein
MWYPLILETLQASAGKGCMGMNEVEAVLRLAVAALLGGALGLNRYVHHKYVGIRTLSIVSLSAAALIVGLSPGFSSDGISRVIQGLLTGVGFIGAGVIVHGRHGDNVRGLTSAATVLLCVVTGILCGFANWILVVSLSALSLLILIFGGPAEKYLIARIGFSDDDSKPGPKTDEE